jgi:activator of HSP90 ATPase
MKTGQINQTVIFTKDPETVYQLLMDQEKHAEFTGSEVEMSPSEGGNFSVFDGYCHGTNIALEKGKRILQHWHFAEDGWPDDHYSICEFLFEPVEGGTRLIFIQKEIPEHKVEALTNGWKEYYWEPMESYLSGK